MQPRRTRLLSGQSPNAATPDAMLVHDLILVTAAAVIGCLGLGATYLALRHSTIMIALVLLGWMLTNAIRDAVDLSVTVAGFHVTVMDALVVPLAVIGVARILNLGIESVPRGLGFVLLALVGVYLIRGIPSYGFQAAVNDARGWLYFSAALVYAATLPAGSSIRIWKLITATGLLLAVIAVPYFLIDGVHSSATLIFRNGAWVTARPVIATGALLILEGAIIAPSIGWPSRRASVWAMLGAGFVLVLLQHRTLWVAGLVVAVVAFFGWSARQPRRSDATVFAATGLLILALPVCVFAIARTGTLITSLTSAVGGNSTLTWRTTGWQELISTHHSHSEIVFGSPAGASLARVINGAIVIVSPHNEFVDAYLSFGVPGFLVFILLGFLLWRRRHAVATGSGLPPHAVSLLLLTQFLFCITYGLDIVQGVIAGVLVSGVTVAARAHDAESERGGRRTGAQETRKLRPSPAKA